MDVTPWSWIHVPGMFVQTVWPVNWRLEDWDGWKKHPNESLLSFAISSLCLKTSSFFQLALWICVLY